MQLYFCGAEVTSHLNILRTVGVERVAVNVSNLARGKHDLAKWATRQRLDGLEWILYADTQHVPVSIALEVLSGAEVQPEGIIGPVTWYETSWLANSDMMFLPVWDGTDPTILREFTETFDGVVLPDTVVDNPTAVRQAKAAQSRLGMLGALTGRSKGLERFDLLCSSAWWSVQKYGETQVWTGDRLIRLNAEDKRTKRGRYLPAIEALGCDTTKVLADDPDELLKCAVLSWLKLEAHVQRGGHAMASEATRGASGNVVPLQPGVARAPAVPRHHMLPVMTLQPTTTTVLDVDGNEVEETHQTITVAPESLRQCNTCALQVACPSFQPNARCSYQIPVMIRSKGQLQSTLRALVEIQTQRILMGRFAEEINGQHDDQVGREMDRLFAMVERWRNIEDQRDSLKLTVEAKGDAGAQMGVLSRLFGSKVGENASRLDSAISVDDIVSQMVDADEETDSPS